MNGRPRRRALLHAFGPEELVTVLRVVEPPPKPKPGRAVLFQAMLDTGQVRNRAELARALGCSRAWVTKVLGSGAAKTQ